MVANRHIYIDVKEGEKRLVRFVVIGEDGRAKRKSTRYSKKRDTPKTEETMVTKEQSNIINYTVICISDFAERFSLTPKMSYQFLSKFGGIEFLMQHYEVEHTLSLDEAIDDLELICRKNGGVPDDFVSRV